MQTTHAGSTVIAFDPKRRAARAYGRRRAVARGMISLWLGIPGLVALVLLGEAVAVLLRHGLAGLGVGLVIVSGASWPLAGKLLSAGSRDPRKRPISRRTRNLGLKLATGRAEAQNEDN
jgi:hypothetical protein